MKINEICENLENVLPNIRWDEDGSNAIREAISLLKALPVIPIYADCDGTVGEIRELKLYGKMVLIFNEMQGKSLVTSMYCHILGDMVKEGEHIGKGDLIGFIMEKRRKVEDQ